MMKKSEQQGERIIREKEEQIMREKEEQQHHIMTVVNSQFETMPLGLSQDIPDVRL